jgi:hypothetical protein
MKRMWVKMMKTTWLEERRFTGSKLLLPGIDEGILFL